MTHSDQNHSSSTSLRESLAAIQHEIWSHWVTYLFSKCELSRGDTMIIPNALILRWLKQINTEYHDLSEQEKESDRHQADKILAILEETE